MRVWFLVLIWLFTRKEEPVPKDLQKFSVVTQVMVTLLNPNLNKTQNTVFCKTAHSNTMATNECCQTWALAEFTALRIARQGLLGSLEAQPCRSPVTAQSTVWNLYLGVGCAEVLDVQSEWS